MYGLISYTHTHTHAHHHHPCHILKPNNKSQATQFSVSIQHHNCGSDQRPHPLSGGHGDRGHGDGDHGDGDRGDGDRGGGGPSREQCRPFHQLSLPGDASHATSTSVWG